jgi:hypothetical protein
MENVCGRKERRMKLGRGERALLAASLCIQACAADREARLPSYQEAHTESGVATVVAVDPVTRQVSLTSPDGQAFTFVAGDQVKSLAQVHVGDQVKVQYYQSIAVEVQKSKGAPVAKATRADPGAMPAGMLGQRVSVTTAVEAIDRDTGHLTIKGPEGTSRVVELKDRTRLEGVAVGDLVVVTYVEGLGVAIGPIDGR